MGRFAKTHNRKLEVFTPAQIGMASLIGMPIAGALMIAHNLRAMRRDGLAVAVICGGLAATSLLMLVVLDSPGNPGLLGVPVSCFGVMMILAGALRNPSQARSASWIPSCVIWVSCLLFVVLFLFLYFFFVGLMFAVSF